MRRNNMVKYKRLFIVWKIIQKW